MRECEFCGKPYMPIKSNQKYCSRQCNTKSAIERYKMRHIRKPRKTKACKFCGKEFLPRGWKHVYCSQTCQLKASGRPLKFAKVCVGCGRHTTLRNNEGKAFCSFCAERERAIANAIKHRQKSGHIRTRHEEITVEQAIRMLREREKKHGN